MVELADKTVEAAWKLRNLDDYERRVERAARRVDEIDQGRGEAALVIYESALVKSGRPLGEIRELVRKFQAEFEDEDEPLTIPRASGIMSVQGNEWFFGDDELRVITGRLLGQFQHRVSQYNYVNEREVLRRWANSHDTQLFIRRRIFETGAHSGCGGRPGPPARAIPPRRRRWKYPRPHRTKYPVPLKPWASKRPTMNTKFWRGPKTSAMHLDLPAPITAALLEDTADEGLTDFPEPPRETESEGEGTAESGEAPGLAGQDQEARRVAGEDPEKGEVPSRVQDPQATGAPRVEGEKSSSERPAAPEGGAEDAPGEADRG